MCALTRTQLAVLILVWPALCVDFFPIDTGRFWTYLGTYWWSGDPTGAHWFYFKSTLTVTSSLTRNDTTYYSVDQIYDSTDQVNGATIPAMSPDYGADSALAYLKRLDSAGAFVPSRHVPCQFINTGNIVFVSQPSITGLCLASAFHVPSDSPAIQDGAGQECALVDSGRVLDAKTGDSTQALYFRSQQNPVLISSVSLADGIGCTGVFASSSLGTAWSRYCELLLDYGTKPTEPVRQGIDRSKPPLQRSRSSPDVSFFDLLGRPVPASLVPQGRGHLGRTLIRKGPDGSAPWFGPGDLRP